jgi:hypothetical protein
MTDIQPVPVGPQPGLQKPGMVTAIGVMTLVNGILNILYGAVVTLSIAVVTVGIGLLCAPLTILPAILGIFEIIYASQILANPPRRVQPSQVIAILEVCCIAVGDVTSMIVGILALVFYNDPAVKAYFARLNAPLPAPVRPAPSEPPSS